MKYNGYVRKIWFFYYGRVGWRIKLSRSASKVINWVIKKCSNTMIHKGCYEINSTIEIGSNKHVSGEDMYKVKLINNG